MIVVDIQLAQLKIDREIWLWARLLLLSRLGGSGRESNPPTTPRAVHRF
jgi:hypothetical protein